MINIASVIFLFLIFQQGASAQEISASRPGKVRIKAIRIAGHSVFRTEELDSIVVPYLDRDLSLEELQDVADSITEVYRRKGYSLARAYVPQQEIKEGVVEIAVLEGKVGQIIIQGNKNYSADFIRRGFVRVTQDKAINQGSLEKSLLLLNENPELKVTALLEAGKEPGSTDIIVNVEDRLPLHLVMDYDNFGTEAVSKNRFGIEVNLARFLIVEGSSLSLRGIIGSDPKSFHYGKASYLLPINSYGTKLGLFGYGGDFDVGQALSEFNITSTTWGYGLYLTHPFVRSRFQSLSGEFGFESKDANQFVLGDLFSRDKLRMLRAGLNYGWIDSTGRNLVSFSIYQGLGDILGAMQNNDPKSSRQGADNQFTKYNLNVARVQRIVDRVSIMIRGSSQASTRALVATEEFYIGGADSVRGYPPGEFLGENGYNVSTELRVSLLPNQEILQMVSFVDHGGVSIKNPAPGVKSYHHLTGVGYGFRLNLPYNISGRFDVGFPVQPSKASSGNRPTLHIQAAARF